MSKNISFVSESAIEERRKVRLEDWARNRKEDDPLEPPEEQYDPRTLYERLQEQKSKKQEEYDESKKLKNLIKGLDNDEIEFLASIDNSKVALENQNLQEELLALEEYKRCVAHMTTEEQDKKLLDFKRDLFQKHKNKLQNHSKSSNKKTQAELLVKAIKRKPNPTNSNEVKKTKHSENIDDTIKTMNKSVEEMYSDKNMPTIQCIGRLPGIGCYDDESDSDLDSDRESDEDDCTDFMVFAHKTSHLEKQK